MHALEIKQLKKTYDSGVQAVKGIDLKVEAGDFFALLGPNGAGKSTTIGMITSLINKTSGQINVFGIDTDKDFSLAKTKIGLVPQEINFNFFERCDKILIYQAGYYGVPKRIAKPRAEYYLKKLNLWDKRKLQARELSGGMKRRLMIARALMNEPELLILDEPTAGVDIEIRRQMWDFLQTINQNGTTIILTTHYLEEAEQLCNKIAIIDKGVIAVNTLMKSLLAQLEIETFILDLATPQQADIDLAPYPTRLIDESTLEIDITKMQSMNDAFALLSKKNINVLSLRNKANRLEELFLRLTNKV